MADGLAATKTNLIVLGQRDVGAQPFRGEHVSLNLGLDPLLDEEMPVFSVLVISSGTLCSFNVHRSVLSAPFAPEREPFY
jgi:hypothetical protein